jgi:predicted MFS family arabinose efflux permease
MISARAAAFLFIAFAVAYFFSALLRAVTATLAPSFSAEMGLGRGDLGLLAGAYFLGFAAPQLPLGTALDRYGPKRVLIGFLMAAVLGCAGFAIAQTFGGLIGARALIGVGVSACLMAPLTSYRRHFSPSAQWRANSWMLMTGSLGMLSSTLPVQWLLPAIGWRGLFWVIAGALALAIVLIHVAVPADLPRPATARDSQGYRAIFRHPTFLRLLPLGFVNYGGMIAIQALWAGPWLTDVTGRTAEGAAEGLFLINLSMLGTFIVWGFAMPRLAPRGWTVQRLIAFGVPVSLLLLAAAVLLGPSAGASLWAAWCVSSTSLSLAQPAVGQAFPSAQAGRALSAYNLAIFIGVFFVQWGIGLVIDALMAIGTDRVSAYRMAFALFGVLCLLAYGWFMIRSDAPANRP